MGQGGYQASTTGIDERFDLFVSYAHSDDEAPTGADSGWVTTLVTELQKVLRRKLGGQGARIWMDHQLAANEPVTPTLRRRVHSSRALLLVMSPDYCQSRWCRDELAQFLATAREQGFTQAVFPVEVEGVDRPEWPAALRALTPISFQERRAGMLAPRLAGYPKPSPR